MLPLIFVAFLRQIEDSLFPKYWYSNVSDQFDASYEDLVIAAPLYSDEEKNIVNGWEVGAIYIYYNDNQVQEWEGIVWKIVVDVLVCFMYM